MATLVDIGTLIVQTPGVCGGRPRIAGTRITIRNIIVWSQMGWTPEKIAEHVKHLSLGQIHAALAYYYANKAMLDAAFANEEAEEARLEREHVTKQRA